VTDNRPTNAAQARRWNGASGQYWVEHRERHLAEHRYLTPHLFRAAAISPGERVLDVGCGCGTTTIAAAQAAQGAGGNTFGISQSGGVAVGLDLSAPMLDVAWQLAAEAGTANARFVRGDAQACPLGRDTCDVVISNFGVMFFDNPEAAFAGIATVVRPTGRLAFLCWRDDTENEVFAIPLRAFGAYPQLPGPAADDLFIDPGRIMELLSGSGWQDVQVTPVTERAWIGSDVDDVMAYVCGMPRIRELTANLGPTATDGALAAIAEEYSARQSADGVWVRAAAWLATARRTASMTGT